MYFSTSLIALVAAGLSGLVSAAPAVDVLPRAADFGSCATPVQGLTQADCNHMQKIGFAKQGVNSHTPNNLIWVGNQGPNTFQFHNSAGVDVAVVMWNMPAGDFQAMCMNVRQAQVTYSVPAGQSITLSVANGVSGAFAGLYNQISNLNMAGQVNNVWGEFTTGSYATVDVSRLINMGGNHMSIKVAGNGCTSEYTQTSSRCDFSCLSGNSCETGVSLNNCQAGSQPGATYGLFDGAPSGGCQGFNNGGHVDVTFFN